MRTWWVAIVAVLVLVAAPAPTRAVDETWIGIGGYEGWSPRPGYTLEVGHDAWRVDAQTGGGVTTVALTANTVVRVRRLSDCAPVVRFVAVPGRSYFIRFQADGSVDVNDVTADGMDSGPALDHPIDPVCPALPDTATSPVAPKPMSGLPLVAVAAGLLAAVAVLRRASRAAADGQAAP